MVLPAIKKPPVVASFVTEKPSRVNAEETAPLSSLLTIARISFIKYHAFPGWGEANAPLPRPIEDLPDGGSH